MRILVGTVEIGGHLVDWAKAFRRLGHTVTTCVRERHWLFPDLAYDEDISFVAPDIFPWPARVTQSRSRIIRFPRGVVRRCTTIAKVIRLIRTHDLFVFQWAGTGLFENNLDLRHIRQWGKKIVYVFNGDDVRHTSAYSQQCKDLFAEEFAQEMCRTQKNGLANQLRNLRRPELYSDVVFSLPNQAGLALRPYMHSLIPLDLTEFWHHIPGRQKPVVVHAPSSTAIKGTSLILQALDRLSNEGVEFDLRLLKGEPHRRVVEELAQADVAIDQLHYALHGMFSLEAMASGCAVATCNREGYEPLPRNRPIWHIEPSNLYDQLKRLLTDLPLRTALAKAGRAYVARYHDSEMVAQRIIRCVEAKGDQSCDHYPVFFSRHYRLPAGTVLPKDVQRKTWNVIRRWGLPDDVDLNDMVDRGLLMKRVLSKQHLIPRWKTRSVPLLPAFCSEDCTVDCSGSEPDCGVATLVSR